MPARRGLGTTLSKNGTLIGGLSSISSPEKSVDTIDTTTLDITDGYKRFIPGLKDGGEVTVKGFFDTADAGQTSLDSAFENQSTDSYIITFPATIGATFQFNGIITKFTPGEANTEDPLSFELTIKVSGQPILATVPSAGLTAMSLSGGGTLSPAAASGIATYSYTFTAVSSITITVTAASQTIKLYVDGVYQQDLTTGSASAAITGFSGAGTSRKFTIVCNETGKSPKVYDIAVVRTA